MVVNLWGKTMIIGCQPVFLKKNRDLTSKGSAQKDQPDEQVTCMALRME